MKVIDHPMSFSDGTRVLLLKGRHKDGLADQRCIMRVSHSQEEFSRRLGELSAAWREGERIYVTAGRRSVQAASRIFRERQLASEYDADPMAFYRSIHNRWVSSLMDPKAQEQKLWLFDCDSQADIDAAWGALAKHHDPQAMQYGYPTKNGLHIVCTPFDRSNLPEHVAKLLHINPIMLWGF